MNGLTKICMKIVDHFKTGNFLYSLFAKEENYEDNRFSDQP